MKRIFLTIFVASLLLGLTACGGGKSSVDYEAILQNFTDALFAGKFEDAKAMVTEEHMDVVSAQLDEFGAIYDKYKFQELLMASTTSGNPTGENYESDKRSQFTYQFSPKDSEDWAYGWLDIRVVNQDGMWVITELNLGRPKK